MKKYIIPAVIGCAAVFILVVFLPGKSAIQNVMLSGADPANTTYLIDDKQVTLIGGVAEEVIENSSSAIRTAIFDQPVIGDLDNDGDRDMALLLQRQTGGSGIFYYLAVALQNSDTTAQGLNTLFVGDRIAPQTIEIKNGVVILNYAERKPDEPMSAQPSIGVSLYAGVENGLLVRREFLP